MSRSPRTTPEQLGKARIRSWIEAKMLDAGRQNHAERKAEIIGAMTGTVVEIGPGTGVNLRFYAPGVHLIAIEPNPNMHGPLRDAADEHGVDLEIRTVRGERIDVDDSSATGVVGTLVLCGVDDPASVVREIRRVLEPGGTYFFVEHVAAPPGTRLRRVQDMLMRPHRWAANGCEINRDTGRIIDDAGFVAVDHDLVDTGPGNAYARLQLIGTATR